MLTQTPRPDSIAPVRDPLPPPFAVPPVTMAQRSGMPFVVVGLALAGLLLWYRGTVMSMVEIWNRSDTYAHGFLIAPISLWLVWRMRGRLRCLPVRPAPAGVLAAALAGFAWLLGELASVSSVSQFALVGMVVALAWALLGTQMAKAMAFPLGFLALAVPFGEFLFPTMMDWTTDFIIGALRLSGVPVYAEGRNLVIPSGRWGVVEGCSGVRYLIASVVVGCLYAYLNYRSLRRRLIFVALSVVVPIFANWLRAYGTVLLGHLTSNRLAAGVDHLVYGWVFFGIVMMALFWIGARWREDDPPAAAGGVVANEGQAPDTGRVEARQAAWIALALLAALSWKPVLGALEARGEPRPVALPAVAPVAGWTPLAAERMPAWSPRYFGMRTELRAGWEKDGHPVWLYLGYYRDQAPGQELVNSENRVVKSKDPVWKMAANGGRSVGCGGDAIDVRSTELFNHDGRLLVWHWYWLGGYWTTNDYLAKVYLVLSRLSGRSDDSAVVMVYTPFVNGEGVAAAAALQRFCHEMGAGVAETLARGMEH